MLARNVTREDLQAAADRTPGVRLHNLRAANARETAFRFTLRTDGPQYTRISATGRKIGGAVSWYGHRDFLRSLFDACPNAIVESELTGGKIRYAGKGDFLASFEEIWNRSVGSQAQSACYGELSTGTVQE